MKKFINKFSFTIVLFFALLLSSTYAQPEITVGANVGYAGLDMKDVNDASKAAAEQIKNNYSNYSVSQEDVGGGLYFDGNVLLTFNKSITTGLSVNYISTSNEFSGDIEGSEFSDKYDFSTIEIMGVIGTKFPLSKTMSLPLRALLGYGLPSIERTNTNKSVSGDGSGGYFAARAQVGIEFDLKSVVLNAFLGYRLANAGKIDLENSDGDKFHLENSDGDEIEYNYSGLMIGAGISVKI